MPSEESRAIQRAARGTANSAAFPLSEQIVPARCRPFLLPPRCRRNANSGAVWNAHLGRRRNAHLGRARTLGRSHRKRERMQGDARKLVRARLKPNRFWLFISEGSRPFRAALGSAFGNRTPVQRCQVHEGRNALGDLPDEKHASVRAATPRRATSFARPFTADTRGVGGFYAKFNEVTEATGASGMRLRQRRHSRPRRIGRDHGCLRGRYGYSGQRLRFWRKRLG